MVIFLHFIGSASLAQVHKAVLKDGHTVAVKIQHKDIQDHSSSDVKTMEVCMFIISSIASDVQRN
jgi:aarF domain-containing kinase